ncbi:MAG: Ig-like domain-containing protein [Vicinamibacterales bacterium]
MRRRLGLIAAAITVLAAVGLAQPAVRRATTIAAVRAYAGFYHQQVVSLAGEVKGIGDRVTLATDEASIKLIVRQTPDEGRRIEARGQVLDIGRIAQDDPRLIPFNLLDRIRTAYPDRWPRPGEEVLLMVSSIGEPPASASVDTPPLRTVAMEPGRFAGRRVTIVGQFRGRNLFGDLPEAPISSKWEYVIRSADAAVWVMGLEPKGKGFSFDVNKRIDSGRWVKIAGTVRTAKGLTWLEGTSIEVTQAPAELATEVAIAPPPAIPVEVLFSAPTAGEADVRLDERIRLQLSRDLDPASLKDRLRLSYSAAESKQRGEAEAPAIAFTIKYTRENRALEILPTQPWERFRTVTVEFLDGVKGTDGGPMTPFVLTFTTGGT